MGQNQKIYDLEERTEKFARNIRLFVERLPKTLPNQEYNRQLIRSSGSIGADFIEANESFSKKDFILRIKICRKEAKETRYWLRLLDCSENYQESRNALIQDVTELMKIFGAIITKS